MVKLRDDIFNKIFDYYVQKLTNRGFEIFDDTGFDGYGHHYLEYTKDGDNFVDVFIVDEVHGIVKIVGDQLSGEDVSDKVSEIVNSPESFETEEYFNYYKKEMLYKTARLMMEYYKEHKFEIDKEWSTVVLFPEEEMGNKHPQLLFRIKDKDESEENVNFGDEHMDYFVFEDDNVYLYQKDQIHSDEDNAYSRQDFTRVLRISYKNLEKSTTYEELELIVDNDKQSNNNENKLPEGNKKEDLFGESNNFGKNKKNIKEQKTEYPEEYKREMQNFFETLAAIGSSEDNTLQTWKLNDEQEIKKFEEHLYGNWDKYLYPGEQEYLQNKIDEATKKYDEYKGYQEGMGYLIDILKNKVVWGEINTSNDSQTEATLPPSLQGKENTDENKLVDNRQYSNITDIKEFYKELRMFDVNNEDEGEELKNFILKEMNKYFEISLQEQILQQVELSEKNDIIRGMRMLRDNLKAYLKQQYNLQESANDNIVKGNEETEEFDGDIIKENEEFNSIEKFYEEVEKYSIDYDRPQDFKDFVYNNLVSFLNKGFDELEELVYKVDNFNINSGESAEKLKKLIEEELPDAANLDETNLYDNKTQYTDEDLQNLMEI